MLIKDLIKAVDKLITIHDKELKPERASVEDIISMYKDIKYNGLYKIYIQREFANDSEPISNKLRAEFSKLHEDIEKIKYSSARYKRISDILSGNYKAVKYIVESPFNDAIDKAIEKLDELGVSADTIGDTRSMLDLLDNHLFDKILIDEKYNTYVSFELITLFLACLFSELSTYISSDSIKQINEEIHNYCIENYNDNGLRAEYIYGTLVICNVSDFARIAGILQIFYYIDYDTINKEQWPFNSQSAIEFLYKQLKKRFPTQGQYSKLVMIGKESYNGLKFDDIDKLMPLFIASKVLITNND